MNTEIEYAVNFLVGTVKDKLYRVSEKKVEALRERLTTLLNERFVGHWYPDKPMKGSAFRCINITIDNNSIDQVLCQAALESDFSAEDMLTVFDKGLALWIDPNDVCCRLGNKGAIFPIYRKISEKLSATAPEYISGVQRHKQRPPQRPRSVTPPRVMTTMATPQYQRSRSTTPPGFSSMDAGQMFQSIPATSSSSYSAENLHKLWDSIPNTSISSTKSQYRTPVSYTSPTQSRSSLQVTGDAVYSFNQYSSYYKPNTSYWKKNTQVRQTKPVWQSDDIYQKYHWSKSDTTQFTGKNLNSANLPSYSSFSTASRQVQAVY